jgi:hypothetical protein
LQIHELHGDLNVANTELQDSIMKADQLDKRGDIIESGAIKKTAECWSDRAKLLVTTLRVKNLQLDMLRNKEIQIKHTLLQIRAQLHKADNDLGTHLRTQALLEKRRRREAESTRALETSEDAKSAVSVLDAQDMQHTNTLEHAEQEALKEPENSRELAKGELSAMEETLCKAGAARKHLSEMEAVAHRAYKQCADSGEIHTAEVDLEGTRVKQKQTQGIIHMIELDIADANESIEGIQCEQVLTTQHLEQLERYLQSFYSFGQTTNTGKEALLVQCEECKAMIARYDTMVKDLDKRKVWLEESLGYAQEEMQLLHDEEAAHLKVCIACERPRKEWLVMSLFTRLIQASIDILSNCRHARQGRKR